MRLFQFLMKFAVTRLPQKRLEFIMLAEMIVQKPETCSQF